METEPDSMKPESNSLPAPRIYDRIALLAAVTIAGAAVMIYEFIAVRILQRYFGGQIDVWASEIAVCMAGLAAGYTLGGRLGDRYRSMRVLGLGLILAGLTGALILPAAEAAGERLLDIDAGLAWHPLIAACISSFLPFLALGTILPQGIRLHAQNLAAVGKTAGNIVALSTVGSIVGVLATGMYLLTHFGVSETLYVTSGVLIAAGIIVAIPRSRGIAAIAIVLGMPATADAQIIFEEYSAYHHILVEDVGDTRILWFDNDQETLMSISNPYAGGFEYADFFHVPMLFDPTIKRVLFMGLGGGTGPKSFLATYPEVRIEVAEIDPMVVRVARRYFAVPTDPRLRIATADARNYLRRARGTYGAIMVDAYASSPRGGYIPYHLATREFFQLASDKLVNGGCLVYNVITMPNFGSAVSDIRATLLTVFPYVYAFRARTSQNTVLVAMKIDYSTLKEDGTRDGLGWPDDPWLSQPLTVPEMQTLAADLFRLGRPVLPGLGMRVSQTARIRGRGRVLVDNFAPTDTGSRRRR
ncbi:MAG: fused MFS/spermidine synthase [Candidatus Hydrogenedentes bacterium]|nr:fused MFS/spermidine synthase [Candidatus Hydrogenedentota bacterium]